MARFDVYRHDGAGFLLDCQADILAELNTRLVVPLLPRGEGPPPMTRLNPRFSVAGEEVIMYTQFAAAIPRRELIEVVASLAEEDRTIMNAIDMLLSGC
jgi:toxin CcdB